LIRAGVKDVENRSWTTNFRGLLYLHAGLRFDSDGYEYLLDNARALFQTSADEVLLRPDEYLRGAILGRVIVRDIALFEDMHPREISNWHEPDHYGWYLEKAEAFAVPIPCKGKLGLFHANIDESAIRVLEV
jgi:hypothetical protein